METNSCELPLLYNESKHNTRPFLSLCNICKSPHGCKTTQVCTTTSHVTNISRHREGRCPPHTEDVLIMLMLPPLTACGIYFWMHVMAKALKKTVRRHVAYRSRRLQWRSWHARWHHHPGHHRRHHAWHLIKELHEIFIWPVNFPPSCLPPMGGQEWVWIPSKRRRSGA